MYKTADCPTPLTFMTLGIHSVFPPFTGVELNESVFETVGHCACQEATFAAKEPVGSAGVFAGTAGVIVPPPLQPAKSQLKMRSVPRTERRLT